MFSFTNRKTERWLNEIKEVVKPLESVNDFSNLDMYVKDKKIILLGESSHGIGDYYSTKIDLIRYLHEKHGFNLLVFENGLLESTLSKEGLNKLSPEMVIKKHFLGIYHTKEMIPLFIENWTNNLKVTGIDIQPSSISAFEQITEYIKPHIDTDLYQLLLEAENMFIETINGIGTFGEVSKELKQKILLNLKHYQVLLDYFNELKRAEKESEALQKVKLIQRAILNRVRWLEINLQSKITSGVSRGRYMYENLEWIINDYYKDEKVIIWAHNFHIRKKLGWASKLLNISNMGRSIDGKFGESCYNIGLYCGKGKANTLLREEVEIKTGNKNYLEFMLNKLQGNRLFIPFDEANNNSRDQTWLKRKWWLLESGLKDFFPIRVYPQESYDAIIFIKEIHPTTYFKDN